ncbi:GNAT family N-acetyltransferase [Microtetraspora fusca]|uniref:GNAT family N-acetyltransferase n=1 Tax=Microtetraspora fusca TaxID=1997 RepID=UPI000836F43B|nr:GNAT family N-acetyltransferase [Microtetraspora fusca]
MQISVIRPNELGPGEQAEWRSMQDSQPHLASPFLSPEFTMAVGEVRDDAFVGVLSEGNRTVGFFPFERHPMGVGKPIAGWVSLAQGVVHRPGAEFDAAALLRGCGLAVWEFEFLVGGQPWFAPYATLEAESVLIDVGGGYDDYLAKVKANAPRTLKMGLYRERKLGRDVGPLRVELHSADIGDLRTLMRWKSSQYRRIGRPDRFGQPWVVELVERLHAGRAPGCTGLLTMLYAGDTPIAGHIGLRSGPLLAGWFPAYDAEFSKYSPGLVQHLLMAKAASQDGITQMDWSVSKGDDYKQNLRTSGHLVSEGCVRRRSAGAALHWVRHSPVRSAKQYVLDRPRLYGVADRVLRRYGNLRRGAAAGSSGDGGAAE